MSLTVIRIFAFLPKNFEFPCMIILCIIMLIILSEHKLEAGGQAEASGKIVKGKSRVSGNICFVNIFYLLTALRWKKVSKCWQTGNESNTKSASESWFIPNVNSEIIKKPGCNQSKWWFTKYVSLYISVLRRKRGIMSQCELNACPCFLFPLLNIFIFWTLCSKSYFQNRIWEPNVNGLEFCFIAGFLWFIILLSVELY